MNDSSRFSGGCLCGAVRFEVTAPSKWCTHCHCSLCRLAHGAAFVTWFGVEKEQFSFLQGKSAVSWHQSTKQAQRGFCSVCGSTMFFESERWAGETHIVLAAMDGPIDRSPRAHVFYDSHVDWVELGDGLPRRGGPTGVEALE